MTFNDLEQWLIDFVASYPEKNNQPPIWREPLMVSAPADDRFARLKEIAVPDHALPADLLSGARSVVVFFVPFKAHLLSDNSRGDRPALSWGRAYFSTNTMINAAGQGLKALIEENGGQAALTPATHNFDEVRLVSLWSHKHLAHLCGLGRFGLNAQMITPAGCGGRLGSLVTDIALGDHPLVTADELCLTKAGQKCGKCAQACPVDAVTPNGINRPVCYERLKDNKRLLMEPDGLPGSTHVCAKCQVGMPCTQKAPLPVSAC